MAASQLAQMEKVMKQAEHKSVLDLQSLSFIEAGRRNQLRESLAQTSRAGGRGGSNISVVPCLVPGSEISGTVCT
jgi:hypothetical protein